MNLLLWVLLILRLGSTAWAQATGPTAPAQEATSKQIFTERSHDFEQLAADYWETRMRLDPLLATFVSHPRYHDKLEDIGPEGRKAKRQAFQDILERLKDIDRERLSESEKLSWDILKLEIERRLQEARHKFYQWDVDHMDGPQTWIATVVEVAQPMRTSSDAEAMLSRMAEIPLYFSRHIENLREGLREGRVAARVPVDKTVAQLESILKTPADQSPYAAAGRRLPLVLKGKYLAKIAAAVREKVYPAYAEYLDFLKNEYRSRARTEGIGLSSLPGGEAAYRFKILYHTTLAKTPEELHETGRAELKSIRAEMEAIATRMGHDGGLASFLEAVRRDPRNFFKTREEILETAKTLVSSATARLPQYFGLLPRTPLVVKPIEDYKEKNDVAARYFQPPDDLSRPGIYYINTYEPETRPRFSMISLAAHEGVPGHHLQLTLAQEQRSLPTFRRQADFTAFVEGWALYSERLVEEMGLYPDDLSRVGMLSDQALRACRLVVDTGIHSMNWSRRQAIDFMKENTPMSEAEITAEVDRYIIWPGQALAYKVGQREILALRHESEARLGPSFDIKAFHDAVLKNGAVPLSILRRTVLGNAL
ncbi:MAG: DUF885 domain-containing protein [Elusimicrobia bacterium]|nr:DUF885 domain-containing protein [Elusimicrobiota bacterium]